MNINGKTFIVSGGASGLGLATSQMIVENGGQVIMLDVNEVSGKEAEETMKGQSLFVKTDVSSEEDVTNALKKGADKFGAINGAISCAGIGPASRVVGREGPHSLALFQKVVNVNLVGTFNVIRLATSYMQHNAANDGGERGVIVNTASVAAFDGQIGQAAYSASKGGIVGMTLPIAREFARMGVRVLTIAPGIFETPMLAGLPQEAQDSLGQQVPFPSRLGKPREFASLVKQIIENPMLNGEVIRLDGAIRMAPK